VQIDPWAASGGISEI